MSVDDLNDPTRYISLKSVPLLDEHSLQGKSGMDVVVDGQFLRDVAANNNRKFQNTGDPAAMIVGHTPDDDSTDQKPVVGWAANFHVAPFTNTDGRTVDCLYADLFYRRDKENVIRDFPRRSVELWVGKREIDPIALLGGTTPERDLGVVRFSRPPESMKTVNGSLVQFYSRRTHPVYRYSAGTSMPLPGQDDDKKPDDKPKADKPDDKRDPSVKKMDDQEAPAMSKGFAELKDMIADMVGKYEQLVQQMQEFQSFKTEITGMLDDVDGEQPPLDASGGMQGGMPPGVDPSAGPMQGAAPAGPPPGAPASAPAPTEEARVEQEGNPVKFGFGMPSPGSAYVPSGSKKEKMSRETADATEVIKLHRQVADLTKNLKEATETIEYLAEKNAKAEVDSTVAALKEQRVKFSRETEPEIREKMLYLFKHGGPEALKSYSDEAAKLWEKEPLQAPSQVAGGFLARYQRPTDERAQEAGSAGLEGEEALKKWNQLRLKFQREQNLDPKAASAEAYKAMGRSA